MTSVTLDSTQVGHTGPIVLHLALASLAVAMRASVRRPQPSHQIAGINF